MIDAIIGLVGTVVCVAILWLIAKGIGTLWQGFSRAAPKTAQKLNDSKVARFFDNLE